VAIDVWADSVQTAAVVIGASAAVFAYRQIRLARHGGGGANVLHLWSFLQDERARTNRRTLYRLVAQAGPFDSDARNWTDDEVEAVVHVCAVWSIAAALAKRDVVPLELLVDEWGASIAQNWDAAETYIEWDRNRRPDPTLYASFEWLASAARAAKGIKSEP
jgi:hypothetical protein